jgi:cytidine deaminase
MPPGPAWEAGERGVNNELFDRARAVRLRAHAPYSRFLVGAALRTGDGKLFAGANVENASYPEGWCAETSAIAHMIAASTSSADRRIVEITCVADPIGGRPTTPCGGCRQRIAEFAAPDTPVHCMTPDGVGQTFRLSELLPGAFSLDVR